MTSRNSGSSSASNNTKKKNIEGAALRRSRARSSNEVQRDSLLGLAVHSRTDSRSSYYLLARPQLPQFGCGLNGKCCEWSNVPPRSYLWQWNNWVFLYLLWRPEGAEATRGVRYSSYIRKRCSQVSLVSNHFCCSQHPSLTYHLRQICHTIRFLFFFLKKRRKLLWKQKPIPNPHRIWEVLWDAADTRYLLFETEHLNVIADNNVKQRATIIFILHTVFIVTWLNWVRVIQIHVAFWIKPSMRYSCLLMSCFFHSCEFEAQSYAVTSAPLE